MKRSAGVVLGVAAVVIALVYWRCSGGSGDSGSSSRGRGSGAATAANGHGSQLATSGRQRLDPSKLSRGSLAGTVTDDKKAPIAKARVCAAGSSNDLPEESLRAPLCATTDDQGRYKLEQALPARYLISASAKTFRPGRYSPSGDRKKDHVTLAAGEHKAGLDIVLRGGGVEITGTVADLTGGPIPGAKVQADAGWRARGGTAYGEADEQGQFSLWVSPGTVRVHAAAEGYADHEEYGHAPGKFDLLLTPESTLSGLVVDAATNQPVEGARVSVANQGEWGWGGEDETAFTNDKGQFRVSRLTPGRHVVVARTDRGYGRTEGSTLVGLGQHVDGVVVKLFPAVRVEGKVVISSTKVPCENASAWLSHATRESDSVSLRGAGDGTLAAEGVLPGKYSVSVGCAGYQERDRYEPVVVEGKDLTGLVWEVDPGATLRGKVLTKSGEPVEAATVWARTIGGEARAKTGFHSDASAADGAYELTGLRAGTYRIEVSTDRGVPPKDDYQVVLAAGATVTQDLVLEDGGRIAGTVVDSEGKPVSGVDISARASTGAVVWLGVEGSPKSDDAGAFALESVRPGDYRVVAQKGWMDELRKPGTSDDEKQGERVTVRANQTSTVKLVVETQSGTIKGTVVDASGAPVTDAFVSAARESDAAGARASSVSSTRWNWDEKPVLTGTDGAFTVGKLAPGKYTVRAFRKGGGEAVAEHVAVGSTAKLQIKATGSIEGTARRSGGPPDTLTVTATDPITGFHRSEEFFKTDGRYALRDLPKGHFRIQVDAEGGQKLVEVDLAEGEAKTGVDVELERLIDITGRLVEHGTSKPVAGFRMFAAPVKGGMPGFRFGRGDEEQENTTDESGRFTIKNAPSGKIVIRGMSKDLMDSDYGWVASVRTVDPAHPDVGDLTVLRARSKRNDPVGELGVNFAEQPRDTPIDARELKVSFIDPAGPAAKTELKVGDILTSIDGVDITGANSMNAWTLMRAPPGTKLTLGIKRGATITVVLAAD